MKRALIVICLLSIHACTDERNDVKSAGGETPVRYVICGLGEKDCFVAARFTNLDACERHRKWSEMLCDTSNPGTMTCTKDTTPPISVAYCTL